MINIIIPAILVVILVFSVYSYLHKLRHGGGCCGEHDAAPKKVKVEDRNKQNYPYTVVLKVDGMTCANCARRVENALNSLPGTWATVDLGARQATVLLKAQPDPDALRQAVRDAGYLVLAVQA